MFAARPTRSAFIRYIGSGEAASYRRLPPLEPQGPFMARTPARPDGAVFEGAGKMPAPSSCRGQRRPVEDVVLADLDLVEVEHAHRLEQDPRPSDDRRRAIGVQPGQLAAFRQRKLG